MENKLGVIVPFRNRHEHLAEFKKAITEYLTSKGIKFELIIIEQDDAKLFNRGMLLNIGFKYARKSGCNYVVFHDVDMIPLAVDYSYSAHPVHLATGFLDNREVFDDYFGGVTLFPIRDFIKIDGYSNKYWGWGYEDDDLLQRCIAKGIELKTLKLKNIGNNKRFLNFNGVNSYVKGKNTFNTDKDITFFISFYPDKFICDHTKTNDDFNVFTIPGYDLAISYNSFCRYSFCTFSGGNKALYVNSKIKRNYKTNMCVVISHEDKSIKVYQDGVLLGSTERFAKLHSYANEKFFYLGSSTPIGFDKKLLKGFVDSFVVYDRALSEEEVTSISEGNVVKDNTHLHYDVNHIKNYQLTDLSGNENHGKIYNCSIVDLDLKEYTEVVIPVRRKSLFKNLLHDENGFYRNRWKDDNTRWNQLRYHNEVLINKELLFNDGLSTLQFKEHGVTREGNITHVNIGI
jgi:beta-1,4-galactosyltransferase 1